MGIYTIIAIFAVNAMGATPSPTPFENLEDPNRLLHFKKKPGDDDETLRLLNQQQSLQEAGNQSSLKLQEQVTLGNDRAKKMVGALKDGELQRVLEKATVRGKQMLQDNPEMKNPIAILAGAFSLWAGRTVKLIREENLKVSAHVEGRSRSGNFSLESPLFNGKLTFTGTDRMDVQMNREISSIDTRAEVIYSSKDQSITGQMVHPLSPH